MKYLHYLVDNTGAYRGHVTTNDPHIKTDPTLEAIVVTDKTVQNEVLAAPRFFKKGAGGVISLTKEEKDQLIDPVPETDTALQKIQDLEARITALEEKSK